MEQSTGFPLDDYTPHGYLDNPSHSWRLGQSGVVRSVDAVGFAWHFPSYPGPYGRNQTYLTALRVALRIGGKLLVTSADFAAAGLLLRSHYHSKNVFTFDIAGDPNAWANVRAADARDANERPNGDFAATIAFLLPEPDALLCRTAIEQPMAGPIEVWLRASYFRNLGTSGIWDFGLFGKVGASEPGAGTGDEIHLGCFAEGPHFVLRSGGAAQHSGVWAGALDSALGPPSLQPEVKASRWEANPAEVGGALVVVFAPGQTGSRWASLGRGWSGVAARSAAERALTGADSALNERLTADAAFWNGAPRLEGDWPDRWRRGTVYDFETLRTTVRPPRGRLRHPWDGMQIQVPRVVLAETALDMLALSYAAPDLAQEVILGTFADALAPNVPCCREDGSVNMVADDGAECGTSPAWGFPYFAVESIVRRTRDRAWLNQVYPHLAGFLEWWLTHRTDAEGWVVFHCGWESGQDESPRFGKVAYGGINIRHLRPVELQAAIAHAADVLARFAGLLGRHEDAGRWRAIAEDYANRTRQLFVGDRFADYDTRVDQFSDVREPLHLAPSLCGVATPTQVAALRPVLRNLPAHGEWTALEWPPVAFTILESAWALSERDLASDLTHDLLERIYRTMDARQPAPNGPLPGIACEHWPPEGDWGTEGYGWGALGCVFLLRNVVGWRETDEGFLLAPNLPAAFLQPGNRYAVRGLRAANVRLDVSYEVTSATRLAVTLRYQSTTPTRLTLVGPTGVRRVFAATTEDVVSVAIPRGEEILLSFEE